MEAVVRAQSAVVSLIAGLVVLVAPSGEAQERLPGGQYGGCISDFINPQAMNLYSLHNRCSVPLHVTICRVSGLSLCGPVDVAPGVTVSVGEDGREVAAHGGFSFAECKEGYYAVDNSGRLLSAPREPYLCQRALYDTRR